MVPVNVWFSATCAALSALAVALFAAFATIRSARTQADAARAQAREQAESAVQVARIEANSQAEGHLFEWLENERRTGSEAAERLRVCERERNEAVARLTVAQAQVERLEEEKVYLLQLISTVGIESNLTRIMLAEAERKGHNIEAIEMLIPELGLERREEDTNHQP